MREDPKDSVKNRRREFYNYSLSKRNDFSFPVIIYILFLVVLFVLSYFISSLTGSNVSYTKSILVLLYYLKFIWVFYLPIVFMISLGIIVFMRNEIKINHSEFDDISSKADVSKFKVIFQIVSRGLNVEALRMSVESVDYWARQYFRKDEYEIWVVTEEDVKGTGLREFLSNGIFSKLRIIFVPKDYKTPRNAMHKARALNYTLDLRRNEGLILDNVWIYLMDEESIVGEDTILSIKDFISKYRIHRRKIAQGIVVYSNMWSYGSITSAGEGMRPVWEIGTEYLPSKYFGSKFSWKGSHLLFNSTLEDQVGWDINVFGDDLVFGLRAQELSKVGFLQGFLYEQRPFTYKESVNQKIRWYKNIVDILIRYRPLGIFWRIMLFVELLIWHASLLGFFLWIIANPLDVLFLTMFLLTYLNIIVGIELNCHFAECPKHSKIKNYLLVPVSLFVIALSPWIGIIDYLKDRLKGGTTEFYVVKK